LDNQIQARYQKVIGLPLEDAGKLPQQEYMKGEMAAFELCKQLPAFLVNDIESELEKRKMEDK